MTLSMVNSFRYHCDSSSGLYQEIGALPISVSTLSGQELEEADDAR